jgi:outer membrane lipoprotein-sorting protein
MKRILVATLLSFTAASLLAGAAQARISSKDQSAVRRVEHYLNNLTTLKARFAQYTNSGRVNRGTIYIRRPHGKLRGGMRIEFDPPVKLLIVATRIYLIVWDGALKEAQYHPLGATPVSVLLNERLRLSGDVKVTEVKREGRWLSVSMVRTKSPEKGSMSLLFQRNPLQLIGWIVKDAQGKITQVRFSNPQSGIKIDPVKFLWSKPATKKDDGSFGEDR